MLASERRNVIAVCFSQFGASFSFNFIMVFIPFYVTSISGYSERETLLWVGAIIGSTGIILSLSAPVWGALAHRFRPKHLLLAGLALHTVAFFLMALGRDLRFLLLLRILQGFFGGVSTIALVIVASTARDHRRATDLGVVHSSITLGQLVGPPLGSLAALTIGYGGAFVSASAVLFASFIFCLLFVNDVPRLAKTETKKGRAGFTKAIMVGFLLCLVSQIQLMFLPSILPNVLGSFGVHGAEAVRWAGALVMLYTVTAMVGSYVWSAVGQRIGAPRMIAALLCAGILLQALMVLPMGFAGFVMLRMAQTGVITAIVPLTLSLFTREPRGSLIGFLNSARFVGNATGPFMATSILAFSNLQVLYLAISGLSLVVLLFFRVSMRR
jgi:MFS family permease